MFKDVPFRKVRFGPYDTTIKQLVDGSLLLRSPHALEAYPAKLPERLVHWAQRSPERTFIAQRRNGAWQSLNYSATLGQVRRIAQALLDRKLAPDRTIAILSDNSIEHLLLGLAAQYVGIPSSPISSAYSLVSSDFSKLRHVMGLLTPGIVFVQSGTKFARALAATVPSDCEIVVVESPPEGIATTPFGELCATEAGSEVDAALEKVGPDTIAKILFTSGSVGMPKGVINTQRMLCSNQQQILQTFPFLADEPPVIVDWLVWNHTFGGNHNVGMMLYNGGSLYIDDGKPVSSKIEQTVANLREIPCTLYFNVPKGFEELIPYLRREPKLRETFFAKLKMLFYAGAGVSQYVWDALEELAVQTTGERVVITTGLGQTESAPSAIFANCEDGFSGLLGLPVPGLDLKLVASEDKLEARYRGPNVMPGYWRQPELTASAFDEEGFFGTGDALKFVNAAHPERGLVFDGRIAEDFKLSTGTWVSVGILRASILAAGNSLIQDVVIAGLNEDYLTAILFPNIAACSALSPGLSLKSSPEEIVANPIVRARVQEIIDRLGAQSTGSATRIARAVLSPIPPSLDAGEITDKGSFNQRAVLRNRTALVAELYNEPPSERFFIAKTPASSRLVGHSG